MFISDSLDICDPVLTFDEFMEGIDLAKYLDKLPVHKTGRLRYNPVNMLKTVLFGFMTKGYMSLRELEENCRINIRFMYLMDNERPTYRTFSYFINDVLGECMEDIFADINKKIFEVEGVDLNHLYIDGSKFEANANKYSWVWKKGSIHSRNNVFSKLNALLTEINESILTAYRVKYELRQEYAIEYVEYVLESFLETVGLKCEDFVHGKGNRKSREQKLYEKVEDCLKKLKKYSEHIRICGDKRNSYSKTDHDATFFRMKKDYMGNDQLLPGYNLQLAVCDEYIAHYGVFPYASDMDCFQPMMEGFAKRYGHYPQYPLADAGYGSYNNYLYCQEHGMEKYMKFTMYEKESKDKKYRGNPYRASNFDIDREGYMVCPNGKRFHFLRTAPVKGNQYGRTEEYYQCEDCEGCSHRERCHKSSQNRVVRINEELTQFHEEVLGNLNSVHGALLRMNRSIQSEGAFGGIKWNRGYKRLRRRGLEGVILELGLISCGFNLHKYHLKRQAALRAA